MLIDLPNNEFVIATFDNLAVMVTVGQLLTH